MSRRIRFIPAGSLVEITCRTLQSRFLLRPSGELVELFVGVLGRAQRQYGLEIHGVAALSNHYHFLVTARDALQLSQFMGFVNSNLAREVGRAVRWRQRFWARRYDAIVVSGEEAAQTQRLRYLLAHGCKEGLVRTPAEWPGVSSVAALVGDGQLHGRWFDRTLEYELRRRGKKEEPRGYSNPETVTLSPLPCWRDLTPVERRQRVEEMLSDIEQEAEIERRRTGAGVLGVKALLRLHPHDQPRETAHRVAPLYHAASKAAREAFRQAYREFSAAFLDASRRFRAGWWDVEFPRGSFPPARPWVADLVDC